MATEINPYAAPSDDNDPGGQGRDGDDDRAYRDGDMLMVPRFGSRLPRRCCVCNAKARENALKRQLYWHPQWVTFLVLVSPLIYVIVSLVIRKNATVEVYVCDEHKRRRTNGIVLMIAGTLAAVMIGVVGQSGPTALVGAIVFLVAIIGGALMMRTVTPAKMDEQYVWLKVGKPYLESVRRSV
jgi:hypothetical protein